MNKQMADFIDSAVNPNDTTARALTTNFGGSHTKV